MHPLDTEGFTRYKDHLQKRFQDARIESPTGELSISEFLQCVYGTIRRVLQGTTWSHAFDRNGYGAQQDHVSDRIKKELQCTSGLQAPALRPTLDMLSLCFPRGWRIPVDLLWRPFDVPVALSVAPIAVESASASSASAAAPASHGYFTRSVARRLRAAGGDS